jgi:hypothetical protein
MVCPTRSIYYRFLFTALGADDPPWGKAEKGRTRPTKKIHTSNKKKHATKQTPTPNVGSYWPHEHTTHWKRLLASTSSSKFFIEIYVKVIRSQKSESQSVRLTWVRHSTAHRFCKIKKPRNPRNPRNQKMRCPVLTTETNKLQLSCHPSRGFKNQPPARWRLFLNPLTIHRMILV